MHRMKQIPGFAKRTRSLRKQPPYVFRYSVAQMQVPPDRDPSGGTVVTVTKTTRSLCPGGTGGRNTPLLDLDLFRQLETDMKLTQLLLGDL